MDKRWSFDLNRSCRLGGFAMREKVFCFFLGVLGPFVRGWVSLYCNSVGCYFSASLQYNFLLIDKKKYLHSGAYM